MDNQAIALWVGTILLGNLAMAYKILVFVIEKVNEYNNLKKAVFDLEKDKEKLSRDLDAAHKMIRDLKIKANQ